MNKEEYIKKINENKEKENEADKENKAVDIQPENKEPNEKEVEKDGEKEPNEKESKEIKEEVKKLIKDYIKEVLKEYGLEIKEKDLEKDVNQIEKDDPWKESQFKAIMANTKSPEKKQEYIKEQEGSK